MRTFPTVTLSWFLSFPYSNFALKTPTSEFYIPRECSVRTRRTQGGRSKWEGRSTEREKRGGGRKGNVPTFAPKNFSPFIFFHPLLLVRMSWVAAFLTLSFSDDLMDSGDFLS
jgi:hypothetical protein